jgi:hypothetical protein
MPDHPTAYIPFDDVYEDGQLVYHAGRKMPYSEAVRLGVIRIPPPPRVKKGRRKGGKKGPEENRARQLEEDR